MVGESLVSSFVEAGDNWVGVEGERLVDVVAGSLDLRWDRWDRSDQRDFLCLEVHSSPKVGAGLDAGVVGDPSVADFVLHGVGVVCSRWEEVAATSR